MTNTTHQQPSSSNSRNEVYTMPSVKYDRLSHAAARPIQPSSFRYDRPISSQNNDGYDVTVHTSRQTSDLVGYDHIPSDVHFARHSEHEKPVEIEV